MSTERYEISKAALLRIHGWWSLEPLGVHHDKNQSNERKSSWAARQNKKIGKIQKKLRKMSGVISSGMICTVHTSKQTLFEVWSTF